MTAGPGTVAEEAAKLFEALGVWARSAQGGGSAAAGDAPGGFSTEQLRAMLGHSADHGEAAAGFADGSPACRLCPLCQLIALVRQARPETFSHLLDASAALTAAVRSMLDHAEGGARTGRSGVERIDLDPPGRTASG